MTNTKNEGIESIHPLQAYILKAGISGSVCAAVSASLNGVDVTKIRMQNQNSNSSEGLRYRGMVSGMRRIYAEEGFKGLTQGIQASMMREITYSSIRMGAYEPIRALLSDNVDPVESSPLIKLFSALISGGIGSAIANPLDLMKTQFQAVLPGQTPPHISTFSGLREVFRQYGFSGLYKGWMVTSARAAVLTSAQLGSYDSIKHNLLVDILGMKESFALHLYASMSAGIITTTAANPCKPPKLDNVYKF